jgi:hypothetical protein
MLAHQTLSIGLVGGHDQAYLGLALYRLKPRQPGRKRAVHAPARAARIISTCRPSDTMPGRTGRFMDFKTKSSRVASCGITSVCSSRASRRLTLRTTTGLRLQRRQPGFDLMHLDGSDMRLDQPADRRGFVRCDLAYRNQMQHLPRGR